MIFYNYKSYCLNTISKTDTSIIIKYKNIDGIFFDKEALIRIGKKTSGFDSLKVINILNQSIIKRNNEQLNNCNQIENNFKQYIISSNKEKEQIEKKHNLKLASKNILIALQTIGISVITVLYLLK